MFNVIYITLNIQHISISTECKSKKKYFTKVKYRKLKRCWGESLILSLLPICADKQIQYVIATVFYIAYLYIRTPSLVIPKANLRRSLEAAIRDSAEEFADGMAACAADLTSERTRDSLSE